MGVVDDDDGGMVTMMTMMTTLCVVTGKVCSALSGYGSGSLCQNNGTCIGNINLLLCNCTGTGHHGAICDKPGEGNLGDEDEDVCIDDDALFC